MDDFKPGSNPRPPRSSPALLHRQHRRQCAAEYAAGFLAALIFTLALCSHLGILYRDPCHPFDGWQYCR